MSRREATRSCWRSLLKSGLEKYRRDFDKYSISNQGAKTSKCATNSCKFPYTIGSLAQIRVALQEARNVGSCHHSFNHRSQVGKILQPFILHAYIGDRPCIDGDFKKTLIMQDLEKKNVCISDLLTNDKWSTARDVRFRQIAFSCTQELGLVCVSVLGHDFILVLFGENSVDEEDAP